MPKGVYERAEKHLEQLKYARSFITQRKTKKTKIGRT